MPTRLVDALRRCTDAELARLLAARPDLAVPVPTDLSALSARAQSRLSLARVLESLDRFCLEMLDALRLSAQAAGPARGGTRPGTARLADVLALAEPVPADRVRATVERLRSLAVVYGPPDALATPHALEELCSPYPAGLGPPAAELAAEAGALVSEPDRLRHTLRQAPPEARAVLDRLAAGPPVGTLREAAGPDGPVGWLVAHHLLVPQRRDTVLLAREVALLLRSDTGPLGALHPDPPTMGGRTLPEADVDTAGAGQVAEAVRLTAALLDAVSAAPPPVLRSGGLGVRDLRRLARAAQTDEPTGALLLEVAREAGLLGDSGAEAPVWLPTGAYDDWRGGAPAARWALLAAAWLTMARCPGLVGTRDPKDKPITALSGEVSRMSTPVLRRSVLAALAELPAGGAPPADDVLALLAWRTPRRSGPAAADAARWALAEAGTLGVTGRGALTGYGRALLAGEDVTGTVADLLPEPVSQVLVQADLTVVVPGPPEPTLAAELELVAEAESTGQASVYRVTPDSVRRALDAGMSAADLHTLLARRSATPVPQALSYLVDDVARRHGGLRVGACSAYLRGEDPALLATLAADRRLAALDLRAVAPTVLVSPFAPHRVLDVLRGAGYAPVAEGSGGVLLSRVTDAPRAAPHRYPRRAPRELPTTLSGEDRARVVATLRRGEERAAATRRAPAPDPTTTGDALGTLSAAIRDKRRVRVGYLDAHGGTASRLVRPVSIGAGYLRAADDRTDTLHTFALHRITSATPADTTTR